MKFLRNLTASILGTLLALLMVFAVFVLVVNILESNDKIKVSNNTVLEINLETLVKDYAPKNSNPLAEALEVINGSKDKKIGLNQILNAIENAKDDAHIVGISIVTNGVNAGIAQTQALRKKLEDFKTSGKFIKAYADMYTQKSYYLCSVADSVFMNAVGEVSFKGLSSEVLFYKDFEDKYGVKMEVIRHGKYKSAVEPFLANKMSDANREQITSFLKSIWNEMLVEISKSRNKTIEELNVIADNLLARNAKLAIENKLIDEAIYIDEYNAKLKIAAAVSSDEKLKTISIADYISTGKGRIKSTATTKIAVIYAQGEIIYGEGDEDHIGQELIIKALKKARNTKSVKAVVLRINSPGGSALASELIWRELALTKKEKPLVVSMGNLAASGGYYIACNADKIFAEPTTITGSIGVFGMLPNVHKFAKNIGINAEQVHTNKSANYSVFEPMTDAFRAVTTESVEMVYTTFLERVSEGRAMSVDEVNKIAQGRVWTGADALNKGLVDEIGGLEDAVKYAAELADVTDYRVRNYPSYKLNLKNKFDVFPFMKTEEALLIETLGVDNYQLYKELKSMANLKGIQARLPYVIAIN
ncbi:signal peptide peptidase SppA [Lutibacter sp.]